MSIEIDCEKRRTLFKQWGTINKESAIQSYIAIHEAEGFDPTYDTIIDYRKISYADLGPLELKEIISEARNIEKRTGRGAFVVGENIGRLTLAKLFCELSRALSLSKVRFKAFNTMEEAEAWLDTDPIK